MVALVWVAAAQAAWSSDGVSGFAETKNVESHVIDLDTVGGLPPVTATYARALHRFGPVTSPSVSTSFSPGFCFLVSRGVGLQLLFARIDGHPKSAGTPATCNFFEEATVSGSDWHTRNGLRIGAAFGVLRRLFPEARSLWEVSQTRWGEPARSQVWWLSQAPGFGRRAMLVAFVKKSHVAALGVWIVGH